MDRDSAQSSHRSSSRHEAISRANSKADKMAQHALQQHRVGDGPVEAQHVRGNVHVQKQKQHQQAVSQPTAEEARKKWREHGENNSQVLENRRAVLRAHSASSSAAAPVSALLHSTLQSSSMSSNGSSHHHTMVDRTSVIYSVRVISAEDRVDPAGSYYTAYLMEVEGAGRRHVVEHRYSEFSRLHAELSANGIRLRSSFPHKSLCGRLGNWTPAQHWAPDKMAELVTYRKIKLDIWLVELAELMARGENAPNGIDGDVRDLVLEFFQKSAAGCPPCDRANPVSWDGLEKGMVSAAGRSADNEVRFFILMNLMSCRM